MANNKRRSTKQLTEHLRRLGAEVSHIVVGDGPDAQFLTRYAALATMLWDKALGYEEKKIDDKGQEKTIKHKPESWAAIIILERLEGKAPQAVEDEQNKISAARTVRELAAARINDTAEKMVTGNKPKIGPPRHG